MRADEQYNAAEYDLENSRRQAGTAITSAFLQVKSGINQIDAQAEAIVAGESALNAKEEGFRAGLTTNLDVLDAQRDLSRIRTEYLFTKYNYFIAVLQLEQAAGELNENDLIYIDQWIDE